MNLVQPALRRPWTVLVAVVAVTLGSFMAFRQMPRDIFPPLGIPTIYVAQPYGGMDPAQMEGFLTYYYEYHFLYITGIEHVESKSIQGAAIIKLQFHPGTEMAAAMAETVSYVNRARAFMPPGTVPPFVTRFDAGSVPVGNLVFHTDNPNRTVGEMQDAALNLVRPLFATLPGVSAPPPFGGSARSIVVNVRPDRLRAYGMSPDEIVAALTAANTISPSGNMPIGGKYPMVPLNSVVKNIHELENLPIRTGTYPAVFLRDVGTVQDASDIVTCFALVNGRRTVYIPVTKRADASTLAVVQRVKENLPKFQSVLPADVKVTYEFDQSPYVTRAMAALTMEGALGALLTGLVILLFLRDWRSALVVVLNIPLSLLGAVLALWITGQTVNTMTLGGLALAVGVLVDEVTVTMENIHAHRARGRPLARAVLEGTRETAVPRLLAMLCVLAVFIPAFFMVGAARAMFIPLSLAVGFSMVASYLLASTFVPVLTVWTLRGHEGAGNTPPAGSGETSAGPEAAGAIGFARLQSFYVRLLSRLVSRRWLVVGVYVLAAGSIVVLAGRRLGTEIFPRVDAGQLQLRLRAPTGTHVTGTEAVALQTLELIRQEAGAENIALTLGFVGVHAPSYPINLIYLWNGGSEEGVLQIQLKGGARVRLEELKERLRQRFVRDLPDVGFSFEPADIASRVMSLGAATPIEVAVSGPNLAVSREFAEKIKERLEKLPSLRDVQFGQALDYPTVDIAVNRERAGLMGVKMSDVSRSLVAATSSSRFVVPNYWADPNSGVAYQIQVQVPQTNMNSLEAAQNLPVGQHDGKSILLRHIASVKEGTTVGQYERYNMQRLVTVTANLGDTDLGTAARQVRQALAEAGAPPPKVSVALRGQVVPMQQMFDGLQTGLLLTTAVVFLLLTASFESVRLAIVVISTVPAVIAGTALALWLTHTTLNIQSFMGAIMAIGVAVANAILLVTFAERHRRRSAAAPPAESPGVSAVSAEITDRPGRARTVSAVAAALEGARSRLRPILMTSLAMIAGMMPMALGLGEGGAQAAPLGRAVVGGLLAATLATLLVLPAVFALLQGRAGTRPISLDPDDAGSGPD